MKHRTDCLKPPPICTRRRYLTASASLLGLAACTGERREPAEKPRVSVVRAQEYDQTLYDTIYRLLVEQALDIAGKRILLKPNLVEFDSNTCINTHPLVVHAVYEACRKLGAAEVRIAEGPGHRRVTLDLAEAAGYFQTVPDFERAFTDLNLDDVTLVPLKNPHSKLTELYLPDTALRADLIISLPKMKTHHWVGATLSMKNFFGVVPSGVYGWPKNVLHWAGIDEVIADLHTVFGPKTVAIVDGIVGMEGNGPIQGTPKPAGVLVAGTSAPAVDAACCRLMGIDPARIGYLTLADAPVRSGQIDFAGDPPGPGVTPFEVISEMAHIRAV